MKHYQIILTIAFILSLSKTSYAQIDITADKISNLEVSSGPFIPIFGSINYDSYAHNFLYNGTNIFSVGNLGLDLQSNMRITRQQPGAFKVDLLPYAIGTIRHEATQAATVSNDTGNFSVSGDDSGVIIVTFNDASVNTSEFVISATPLATDITSASQVTVSTTGNNTFRIFLYTPGGSSIANYGVNLVAYKP